MDLDKLGWQETIELHIKTFGVKPKRTGVRFHEDPFDVLQDIKKSIKNNEPYVEEAVPKGAVI